MKPVIAIVGRANVGKSTLFNRLTKTRDAIVADIAGLTRDRHYGQGKVGKKPFIVVDTGGFEPVAAKGIVAEMAKQTEQAIIESDLILFVVEAHGLNEHDKEIAHYLRRLGRPIHLVINKSEGRQTYAAAEFAELGFVHMHAISASHGQGVTAMLEYALKDFDAPAEGEAEDQRIKIAIAGRPNVGKSTFINALLGEERLIAFDQPGTTRDAIYVDFDHDDKNYTLIDTAGMRRRGKVFETIEKFSVIKTLQSITDSHVVVLMLDASQDISDQDAHIARFVVDAGRALVVTINKWDALTPYARQQAKEKLERQFHFLQFAAFFYISAQKKQGIYQVLKAVDAAYQAAMVSLSTPKLTRVLHQAVEQQAPKRDGIFRPKMRYAHQGGKNPPIIIIHGSRLEAVQESYTRYLERKFREVFSLQGTPLRIDYKNNRNPYVLDKSGKGK